MAAEIRRFLEFLLAKVTQMILDAVVNSNVDYVLPESKKLQSAILLNLVL